MLVCRPALQRLIQHNYPSLRLFRHWTECPEFHAFCALSGLPRLHGTSVETIPAEIPYLAAVASDAAAWKGRLDRFLPASPRRIGIVWAGRPQPPNRSIGLKTLAPLCALDDVALISLQAGPAQDEVGAYYGQAPMVSVGNDLRDFMDTAAVIDGLDLVITIDTAVAHLAGAMGKPVWVILPYSPDWRWLLHRNDSPWYPTARLFRQPAPQQWGPVLMLVAEELRRRTLKECSRRDKDAGAVR